jgi:hypothetical protein
MTTIKLPEKAQPGVLPDLEALMTISRAAVELGISRQAAHKMAKSGRIKAWRIPSAGNDRPLVVLTEDVLARKKEMLDQGVVAAPDGRE